MNGCPIEQIPPNIIHLQRTQFGAPLHAEPDDISVPAFDIGSSPFFDTIVKRLVPSCRSPLFGFTITTDDINNRAFVADIRYNSSASKMFSSHKAATNKIRDACIISIDGIPVFTNDDVLIQLDRLHTSRPPFFDIEFAPEKRMAAQQLRDAMREHNIFHPDVPSDTTHIHHLYIADIRAIAHARFPGLDFSPDALPYEHVSAALHAIQSSATTSAEQGLGHFTPRKLKKLDTWPLWEAGERKQLDQFHELGMYGMPVPRPPPGAVILRQH